MLVSEIYRPRRMKSPFLSTGAPKFETNRPWQTYVLSFSKTAVLICLSLGIMNGDAELYVGTYQGAGHVILRIKAREKSLERPKKIKHNKRAQNTPLGFRALECITSEASSNARWGRLCEITHAAAKFYEPQVDRGRAWKVGDTEEHASAAFLNMAEQPREAATIHVCTDLYTSSQETAGSRPVERSKF
jgi:hypothetical protein